MLSILLLLGHTYVPEIDIALVTGGASGLGKEIVHHLTLLGGRVVVVDIVKVPAANRVPGVCYYQCDVTHYASLVKCQKYVEKKVGNPTVLINNAAVAIPQSILETSVDQINRTVAVNLILCFYTVKVFLPAMVRLKRGYIVTVSSVLAFLSPANLAAYGAAKSGLLGLHESLTFELTQPLRNSGIKTLLLCPGQLTTALFQEITNPLPILAPLLEPDFVARLLVAALRTGKRGDIKLPFYGEFLPLLRILPWPVVEAARRYAGIDRHSLQK